MAVTDDSRRRILRIVVPLMTLAIVGLPLAFRAISPFTDSGFVPAAPGLVQIGLGIALGLAGVLLQLRGIADASRFATLPRLPRPVRRAVLRCRDVPEELRARVPDWLDCRRALCLTLAGPIVWGPTVSLVLNADDSVRSLEFSVAFWGVVLTVVAAPLVAYVLAVRRARRHYAG